MPKSQPELEDLLDEYASLVVNWAEGDISDNIYKVSRSKILTALSAYLDKKIVETKAEFISKQSLVGVLESLERDLDNIQTASELFNTLKGNAVGVKNFKSGWNAALKELERRLEL